MPSQTSSARLLGALDEVVLKNRAALYEGNVLSVLRGSPHVVRAFEFSPADAAIHCTLDFDTGTGFADRLWTTDRAERDSEENRDRLVLFDVKSNLSHVAGGQVCVTTRHQQSVVAFYVCAYAADPAYVDVIPNYRQGVLPDAALDQAAQDSLAVNTSRESYLPSWAYGHLDPSNAPYRMPVAMLNDAVRLIRDCANHGGTYTNPWTRVRFPGWRPSAHGVRYLKPAENTEHFTAFKAAFDIYGVVKTQKTRVPIELDFVGLQPRLADFKFIVTDGRTGRPRQVFVQHKLDRRDRALSTPLNKVHIGRTRRDGETSFYFSDRERFDFLFYQFDNISTGMGPHAPRRVDFFFLPERVLPDVFYTTLEVEESFARGEFDPFKINMDADGRWVHRVVEIIRDHETPRRQSPRPSRRLSSTARPGRPRPPLASKKAGGRHLYAEVMAHGHQQLFDMIMMECAQRQSGLIVALAAEHPVADFGFCRYSWTRRERLEFAATGTPPKTVSSLPGLTPAVPIVYHARHLECGFHGPDVSSSIFRRLNSCKDHRLVVWNVFGPDELDRPHPLLVIPSEDMRPTEGQRVALASNLGLDKSQSRAQRTPLLSALLQTGLHASEYASNPGGPLAYSETGWAELWLLFDRITRLLPFEHPAGVSRLPGSFLQPLRSLHERLVQEDQREPRAPPPAVPRKRSASASNADLPSP